MSNKEQNGEREISSFTLYESIDYVIKALNDGGYQEAYKSYLEEVLEHIRSVFPEPVPRDDAVVTLQKNTEVKE